MKKILLSGVKPTGQVHIGNYFGAMKQFVDLQNSGDYKCIFMIADYHALNFIQNKQDMSSLTYELMLDYLAIGLDPKKSIIFKQSDVSAHTELSWIFDTIVTVPYLMRSHAFKSNIDTAKKSFEEKFGLIGKLAVTFNKEKPPILESKGLVGELINEAQNYVDFKSDNLNLNVAFSTMLNSMEKINVGTFNYPVLMAADILLYDTDVVPVGQDQKQHVEYARDIAIKFNHIFGGSKNKDNNPSSPIFKLPEDLIMKEVATVPGIDGRKMSKSYNNTIPLFATREDITKAVMSIVTDSSGDVPTNVFAIHKLFKSEEELKRSYESNKGKYKILKEMLIEDIDAFIKPMRERRLELAKNPEKIRTILADGSKQAKEIADQKLCEVKQAIGVI